MPKTKISEFSATPGNNTDIDGINIAEGCAPSGINDAIRELMAQLKDFQAGTAGDSFNGPVGTSTAAAGAFTTLSATGVATFSSGTAGAPAITTTGDTNTGIFFPAADTVAASVGGTEGLRLTSTGLGVGTSSPSFLLHASASSAAGTVTSGVRNTATDGNTRFALGNNAGVARATISLNNNSDEKMTIGPEGSFPMLFQTNGSERARITSGGDLLVGITSAPLSAVGRGNITINGSSTAIMNLTIGGTSKGYIFHDDNSMEVWNSDNSYMRFGTNNAERARITSGGDLLVGRTSAGLTTAGAGVIKNAGGAYLEVVQSTNGVACMYLNQSNGSGTQTVADFRYNNTQVGTINVTSTACTYNNLSDYRLKTVIGSVSGAGARIDALEPVEYEWKVNGARTRGFLAHKFQEVYPQSVAGEKDAVDAKGKPVYQSMQASTSEVIADLVAEIQSLRARVAALESNP